jgi:uncharacterized protein (DUF433 family)
MGERSPRYVNRAPKGGWRISGSRVSLESIVRAYLDGLSAESILEDFPTLTLEKIYGAIAYYLHNRDEVERYLAEQDKRWDELRKRSEIQNKSLLKRIRARRTAKRSAV